jgi:lysophospholipid acyltransferase (LPLAT)-like uncharacterized protein
LFIPINPPRRTFLQRLGLLIAPAAVTLLVRTLRIAEQGTRPAAPSVIVFWHGVMLVPWFLFRDTHAASVVSRSADGDVLASVLMRWGFHVVRGSSSDGGRVALREMVDLGARGMRVLVTPDGPRGPALEFKIGALVAAQRARVPLCICYVHHARPWRLRSWDSFEIPKLFSRVRVRWEEPIAIDPDCIGDRLDALRSDIESRMRIAG